MNNSNEPIVFHRLRALDKVHARSGDITHNDVTVKNTTNSSVIPNNIHGNDIARNNCKTGSATHNDVTRDDVTVTHVVCDALSATSWLSPIGVTAYPRSRSVQTKKGRCPIKAEACEEAVQRRARATALLLGQRVHHVTQQGFPTNVILQGTTLKRASGLTAQNIQNNTFTVPEVKLSDNTRPHTAQPCISSSAEKVVLPVRPKTSLAKSQPGLKPLIIQHNDKNNLNNEDDSLLRIISASGSRDNMSDQSSNRKQNVDKSAVKKTVINHKEHAFASLEQLQKHLQRRIAGLPPGLQNHLSKIIKRHCSADNQTPQHSHTDKEKQGILERKARGKRYAQAGTLKPLLYDASSAPHSAQCSAYQCKNCFRACLAADNFRPVVGEKSTSKMAQKNKMAANKQRIRLVKRNMPDAYAHARTQSRSASLFLK